MLHPPQLKHFGAQLQYAEMQRNQGVNLSDWDAVFETIRQMDSVVASGDLEERRKLLASRVRAHQAQGNLFLIHVFRKIPPAPGKEELLWKWLETRCWRKVVGEFHDKIEKGIRRGLFTENLRVKWVFDWRKIKDYLGKNENGAYRWEGRLFEYIVPFRLERYFQSGQNDPGQFLYEQASGAFKVQKELSIDGATSRYRLSEGQLDLRTAVAQGNRAMKDELCKLMEGVLKAVDNLPSKERNSHQKEVVEARYRWSPLREGKYPLLHDEVAKELGISSGSSRQALRSAKEKILKEVGDDKLSGHFDALMQMAFEYKYFRDNESIEEWVNAKPGFLERSP